MAEDWKEVCIGGFGPYPFDANAEQNPDGDPPDTTLQRAVKTDGTVVCADPIENNEAVTLGHLGTTMAGYVPAARLINTTLPLSGGGNLSADRTLVLNYNTDDLGLSGNNLYVKDAGIDHDATTNFVAMEHMNTEAWAEHLIPNSDNARDLGAVGARWKDLFLSGNLHDGSNYLTVAQAKSAYTHSQIAGGNSVHVSTTENTNWDAAYAHSLLTNEHIDWTAAASTFLTSLTGHFGGAVYSGVDDTQYGVFQAFGHGTGSDIGGRLYLNLAADYDTTYDHYLISVLEDDLIIGRINNVDFKLDSSGNVTLGGNLIVGSDIGVTGDTDLLQLAANLVTINGNLGIRTTASAADLEIAGVGATADTQMLRLSNVANTAYYWEIWRDNIDGDLRIGHALGGAKTTRATFENDGSVTFVGRARAAQLTLTAHDTALTGSTLVIAADGKVGVAGACPFVYVDGKKVGVILKEAKMRKYTTYTRLPKGNRLEIKEEENEVSYIEHLALMREQITDGQVWLKCVLILFGNLTETYTVLKKGHILTYNLPIEEGDLLVATGFYEPAELME